MSLDPHPSTAELLTALQLRTGAAPALATSPAVALADVHTARPRSVRGHMNKTETRVAEYLDAQKRRGAVLAYYFDALSLRLADATYYRPDFLVLLNAMPGAIGEVGSFPLRIIILEAKGHWEDDARVKFKVAARQYPHFTFIAARRLKQGERPRWQLQGLEGFEAETIRPRPE